MLSLTAFGKLNFSTESKIREKFAGAQFCTTFGKQNRQIKKPRRRAWGLEGPEVQGRHSSGDGCRAWKAFG